MVIEKLVEVVTGIVEWLLDAIPDWSLPEVLMGAPSAAGDALGMLPPLPVSTWLGVGAIKGALTFVAGAFLLASGVRFGRIVASFLSGGGGSAA